MSKACVTDAGRGRSLEAPLASLLCLLVFVLLPQAGCAQDPSVAPVTGSVNTAGDARPEAGSPQPQPLVPDPGSLPPATGNATFGQRALALINQFRIGQGLGALQWERGLAELAAQHGAYMDHMGKLSHDNFQQRYESAASGVCVENVAWNLNTPEALLEHWKNSPQHAQNLLQPDLKRAGIARVGYFVTFFACD